MTSMKSTAGVGGTGGRIYLVNGVELTREYLDSKWIQETETKGANELRSENEIKKKQISFP